jgi:CRISPR-associated exonuclease Cas4
MSAALLLVVLALALAAYVLLRWWTRRRRARLGLAGGALVSADDSLVRAPTLRSERLGLVGRCDHLLRVGDAYVPVEQKPSSRRLQPSHIMQVGALCLLVEDVYGVRPPYGVVVLAGGAQERVVFSEALERGVVRTMSEMRRILASGEPPGPRWVGAKCWACGHHPVCWDDRTAAAGEYRLEESQRAGEGNWSN